MALDDVGDRVINALGPAASRELLDVLARPEEQRAALIGRLSQRDDASWLADILIELEVDEPARLQLAEAIRRRLTP